MTTTLNPNAQPSPTSTYDNQGQYTRAGILRYEKVFGHGYVSTGGHETTEYLCEKLGDSLKPGVRVLDVGSGIGGAMFHLAKAYGAIVTGVDLAPEMIKLAGERAEELDAPSTVTSILGDVLTHPFEGKFGVVWSRDALMHLPDKPRLFSHLIGLTEPGGRLVITDYARGVGEGSPEFRAYIASTGYHVVDPATYGKFLEAVGYVEVQVEDATERFVGILEREIAFLDANRADFLGSFSETDLDYLVSRWKMKVGFCRDGDMKWGIYLASKPA
jgi:phosphoethanolamine N-methyltransferase